MEVKLSALLLEIMTDRPTGQFANGHGDREIPLPPRFKRSAEELQTVLRQCSDCSSSLIPVCQLSRPVSTDWYNVRATDRAIGIETTL